MIDFEISPEGDLLFEKFEPPQGFKLGFRIAESPGLTIKFHVSDQKDLEGAGHFKLSFLTKQKTGLSHKASLVNDNEQKLQRIRIALTTERGELPSREWIGSRLSLTRHEDLYDDSNLRRIEEYVGEAIQGILSSPEVIAKPERGVGHFYCQTVGVYIYENDILIFKFFI